MTTIVPGTRLGPYEIVGRVGEGGMGVVYRARDERLGRDVAVKVIPSELASDKERLRRFQIEARAAGQLNHPNIVIIHDLGTSEGAPYIVSEMLEGETLRPTLERGPLPARRAVTLAIQIAHGLASAHSAGIVHRDLKPENLFLNRSGVLKILDFGIAKLFQSEGAAGDETASVLPGLTRTGTILGTASYMAPEQIREQTIDQRTDLFAFGAILYEMLTGEKAFPGATPADRMSAILNKDTPPLPREVESEVSGIGRIVSRCLEKRPEDRFQTATDLGFALELLVGLEPSETRTSEAAPSATQFPRYERVTYREGNVRSARFAPDGQSVIYGAALESNPLRLYWSYPGSPEARGLGLPGTDLLSVSSVSGELAVSLRTVFLGGFVSSGTLARMPLGGGAARELVDDVIEADWGPDGRNLSVVREKQGMIRLEYPVGRVLYQTPGWVSHARVSPDGKWIAFLDHPFRGDDAGGVAIVDMEGRVRHLVGDFASSRGLAWTPKGDEIWFSAAKVGADRFVHAVRLDGSTRQVFSAPGACDVLDIAKSGTLLIAQGDERLRMEYRNRAGDVLRDLTWLDWSLIRDMSPDGRTVLFDETGAGGGSGQSVYMRDVDGSPAIRLGDGTAVQLSPDGRWALAFHLSTTRAVLLPTGVGEPRPLTIPEGLMVRWGAWHPDRKSLVMTANEPGKGSGLYRVDLESNRWSRISDRELSGFQEVKISPDGSRVMAQGADAEFTIFPMDGGEPRSLPGIPGRARIIGWSEDGGSVFYMMRGEVPAPVFRIDIETGERTHWVDLAPRSLAGVVTLTRIVMTPDAEWFAYSYPRFLTNLYKVEGLL